MKLDLGSFAFGSSVESGGNTPSWGTALGQIKPDLKLTSPGYDNIVIGMVNKSIPVDKVYIPLGKGGHISNSLEDDGILLAALFDKVYVNEVRVNAPYVLLIYREDSTNWAGRKTLKYNIKTEYRRGTNDIVYNTDFVRAAQEALQLADDACWVISDLFIVGQDELHMIAGIVNPYESESFPSAELRKAAFLEAIKTTYEENPHYKQKFSNDNANSLPQPFESRSTTSYRPFITAIKSKPFLLLAGISGTGKSRIVRELARACWDEGSEEYKAQKPKNFEMIQVRPNWHDSSELIGYVSRIDGVRYVVGPFLKFMVKAMRDPETPYFLCLDEMNLAPVEQYFAEYLSVVESRKLQDDGSIATDPIIDYSNTEEYKSLIDQLFSDDDDLRKAYLTESERKRLSIPQNLIVVGTVNMDETTFSFSRKVLDRAMTIEMNEVDLYGGLDARYEHIGKLGAADLIGTAVEGVDVYRDYKDVCDKALAYLKAVNEVLEGTPFKIAYRTRNEFLLYVVNNMPYNKDESGNEIPQDTVINRSLDEITSMKILSRIEGDSDKVGSILDDLKKVIGEELGEQYDKENSVSLKKLLEMKKRLESGYTSFWS